MIALKE
jgi:hypothetical protein